MTTNTSTRAHTRTRIEDVEWMALTGESRIGAAARLGMNPRTLDRYLDRHGRSDLIRTLAAQDPPTTYLLPHELRNPHIPRPNRTRRARQRSFA